MNLAPIFQYFMDNVLGSIIATLIVSIPALVWSVPRIKAWGEGLSKKIVGNAPLPKRISPRERDEVLSYINRLQEALASYNKIKFLKYSSLMFDRTEVVFRFQYKDDASASDKRFVEGKIKECQSYLKEKGWNWVVFGGPGVPHRRFAFSKEDRISAKKDFDGLNEYREYMAGPYQEAIKDNKTDLSLLERERHKAAQHTGVARIIQNSVIQEKVDQILASDPNEMPIFSAIQGLCHQGVVSPSSINWVRAAGKELGMDERIVEEEIHEAFSLAGMHVSCPRPEKK